MILYIYIYIISDYLRNDERSVSRPKSRPTRWNHHSVVIESIVHFYTSTEYYNAATPFRRKNINNNNSNRIPGIECLYNRLWNDAIIVCGFRGIVRGNKTTCSKRERLSGGLIRGFSRPVADNDRAIRTIFCVNVRRQRIFRREKKK